MTLAVKVSHDSPGYPMRALVTPVDSNGVPHGSPDNVASYQRVLASGESTVMYVHSGCTLHVEEIGPAADETAE